MVFPSTTTHSTFLSSLNPKDDKAISFPITEIKIALLTCKVMGNKDTDNSSDDVKSWWYKQKLKYNDIIDKLNLYLRGEKSARDKLVGMI